MVEGNEKIMNMWNEFYENVRRDVMNNMNYYKKFYENLYEKWTNFTNAVTSTIKDSVKDSNEDFQELYNLWKNYQIKMNARIQRAYEVGTENYKEMMNLWEDSREKLTTIFTSKKTDDENENAYLSWMDITTAMTRKINKAMADCNGEYREMTKTWFEFMDKMREGMSSLEKNPKGAEVTKGIQDMLTNMSYEISNYISMCSKSAVNFQKNWMNMLGSARKMFSSIFPSISYEELYSGFFDRGPWRGAYGAFVSSTKVRKLEEEVKELRMKLKMLEEQIEKEK